GTPLGVEGPGDAGGAARERAAPAWPGKAGGPASRHRVEADRRPLVEELAVGVDPQRKPAGETRLGVREFSLARSVRDELGDDRAHTLNRGLRLVATRLEADLEWPRLSERKEVAVDAVGEAVRVADVAREARHEPAPAENVVADEQREVVGIVTGERRDADEDVRLFSGMEDHHPLSARRQRDLRQRSVRTARAKRGRELLGDFAGLVAGQVAENRDDYPIRGVMISVEALDV